MQRIYVSANRRFLMKADGTPFFWLGDTAWELFHRCDRDEVEFYLENCRQKGFNVIQAVVLAEEDGLNTPNSLGNCPLIDNDPTQPDEAYFQHVDYVAQMAAKKGLYIGMLPTWGDKVTLAWGVGPIVFDIENAFVYGEYLGKRYADYPNIIWIIGGDRPLYDAGHDYGAIFKSMARGIQHGVNGHTFMTFHPAGRRGSSQQLHHEDWLDMNMWQSGHRTKDIANWELISNDYALIPPKPTIDGEPCYEDHPIDPYTHERYAKNYPDRTWQEALDRPGASQIIHLRELMESRPYFNRIPDQTLILSADGTGGNHLRATRADDGSYAMLYLLNAQQSVEADLSRLSGDTVYAQWFDPRTGSTQSIGQYKVDKSHSFISPEEGPDWVLLLDSQIAG